MHEFLFHINKAFALKIIKIQRVNDVERKRGWEAPPGTGLGPETLGCTRDLRNAPSPLHAVPYWLKQEPASSPGLKAWGDQSLSTCPLSPSFLCPNYIGLDATPVPIAVVPSFWKVLLPDFLMTILQVSAQISLLQVSLPWAPLLHSS